jgi:hypothetical protein
MHRTVVWNRYHVIHRHSILGANSFPPSKHCDYRNGSLHSCKVSRAQKGETVATEIIKQLCHGQDQNQVLLHSVHYIDALLCLFQAVTGKRAAIRAKTA